MIHEQHSYYLKQIREAIKDVELRGSETERIVKLPALKEMERRLMNDGSDRKN